MARGGSRGRRTYVRDGRGRFASTPGSKAKPSGLPKRTPRKVGTPPAQRRGLVTQRAAVRRSAGKLKKLDPANTSYSGTLKRRAQKAAVTRAANKLTAAKASGRRAMALNPAPGVLKRQKGQGPDKNKGQAPQSPKATRAPRGTGKPRGKSGKKVDVQIRRAAAGGEYGPDGHFYPAGSWMPAGKFVGAKPQAKGKGDAAANGKGKDGGDKGTRVVRQKEPSPPIVRPSGKAVTAPTNISPRGERNRDKLFGADGYVGINKQGIIGLGKDGFYGYMHKAAVAARLTAKQVGQAILKLRRMAKDKAKFDDGMNYDRNSYSSGKAWQENRGAEEKWWYDRMRREGLLPRGTTLGQFRRAEQLIGAVNSIASQRAGRPNNRRTSAQEFAWVFNNILGSKAPRKPTRKPVVSTGASGAPRRARMTGIGSGYAFRPISTKRLIAAGGSRWQKDTMDRVYFNAMREAKIYFDRSSRQMGIRAFGDQAKAQAQAEARKIERQGRRPITRRTPLLRRRKRTT